jgi:ribosomal protein L37AE/L43A
MEERIFIICPFCHGDAVKNRKGEFVCEKCGKKVDQNNNAVKPVKKVSSQPWYTA